MAHSLRVIVKGYLARSEHDILPILETKRKFQSETGLEFRIHSSQQTAVPLDGVSPWLRNPAPF